MNHLFKRNFNFKANSYEEYCNGQLTDRDFIDLIISATVNSNHVHFDIYGDMYQGHSVEMHNNFNITLVGADILPDRIQYGLLPRYYSGENRYIPVVCNIFNNKACIRFAMLNPLRIIEFKGYFI